jgi:hypothetical protein
LKAKGFSCSWGVLFAGPEKKKKLKIFGLNNCFFFSYFVIKTLDPDPDLELDPDPH